MSDKLITNLAIAGKNHPISFAKEDEELIRRASKMVGELTANYQKKYEDSELEIKDFFSFAAFQFAFEYLKLADQKSENSLLNTIKVLDADLEQYLKEK